MVVSLQRRPAEPGTRDAIFTGLFAAEFDYVWASLRRLGVNERDVEDIAHDVFLHVYRKLGSYDPKRPVRPWLFGFAYRAASDYRLPPGTRTSFPIVLRTHGSGSRV